MSLEQGPAARAAASAGPAGPLRLRHLVPLAVVATLCAACYGLTVVPTYVAQGPDTVPASQVGGAYDPTDQPFLPWGHAAVLGYAAILVTPFAAGAGVLFVGLDVVESVRTRRPWRAVLPSVVVLTLCTSVMTAYVALGRLTTWWLD